ncbi:hypothetical protein BS50DRAFT_652793 [Corynespora cassiicola Philippines]|uniref:Uncharacterized protein n=1 Tax=Corynespora cassiicola Philippines TaxID=1448308 RepID=A0A2T2N789_CORCC|nr:hypothetical protein BS50DRAFT_652793 [Corynespora cassiicola Philippines]
MSAEVISLILELLSTKDLLALSLISFFEAPATRLLYREVHLHSKNIYTFSCTVLQRSIKANLVRRVRVDVSGKKMPQVESGKPVHPVFISATAKLGLEDQKYNAIMNALAQGDLESHAALLLPNLPKLSGLDIVSAKGWEAEEVSGLIIAGRRFWTLGCVSNVSCKMTDLYTSVKALSIDPRIEVSIQDMACILQIPSLQQLQVHVSGSDSPENPFSTQPKSCNVRELDISAAEVSLATITKIFSTFVLLESVVFSGFYESESGNVLDGQEFFQVLHAFKDTLQKVSFSAYRGPNLVNERSTTQQSTAKILRDFIALRDLTVTPYFFGNYIESPYLWDTMPHDLVRLHILGVSRPLFDSMMSQNGAISALTLGSALMPRLKDLVIERDNPYDTHTWHDLLRGPEKDKFRELINGLQNRSIFLRILHELETDFMLNLSGGCFLLQTISYEFEYS